MRNTKTGKVVVYNPYLIEEMPWYEPIIEEDENFYMEDEVDQNKTAISILSGEPGDFDDEICCSMLLPERLMNWRDDVDGNDDKYF